MPRPIQFMASASRTQVPANKRTPGRLQGHQLLMKTMKKWRKTLSWRWRRSRIKETQAPSPEYRELVVTCAAAATMVADGLTREATAHDVMPPIMPGPAVRELDALASQVQQHEPEWRIPRRLPDATNSCPNMSPPSTSSNTPSESQERHTRRRTEQPLSTKGGCDRPCDDLIVLRRPKNKRRKIVKANVERPAPKARKKSMASHEYRSVKRAQYVVTRERNRRELAENKVEELERLRASDREETEELMKCLVLQNNDLINLENTAAAALKQAKQDKRVFEMDLLLQISLLRKQHDQVLGERNAAISEAADLRKRVAKLEEEERQHARSERIRKGVARLLQADLRKQVAHLETQNRLLSDIVGHPRNELQVPASVRLKHMDYRQQAGDTVRQFHGTSCGSFCNFIVDPQGAAPCRTATCNLCSICQQGFKLGKCSRRYGKGVYFTSEARKAGRYADGTKKTGKGGQNLRCVFVADVASGRTYKTKKTGFDKSAYPPKGYDSVLGEVGQGLTSDELVVYREDAALPTHLVVYALS